MQFYPDNTVAKYRTQLLQDITLEGEWEVGLYEFTYQRTWYNVDRGDTKIRVEHTTDEGILVSEWINLREGYYSDIDELINAINKKLHELGEQLPQFRLEKLGRRLKIYIRPGMHLIFSESMRNLLGIKPGDLTRIPKTNKSHHDEYVVTPSNTYDVDRNCSSLYLYCDIVDQVIVGDTKAPLLRSIDVTGQHGSTVRERFEKPMYVPVQKKHFESIEIDIRTDTGAVVPFQNGKSSVTLHFRKSRDLYFL
jgi:hypothetical protein